MKAKSDNETELWHRAKVIVADALEEESAELRSRLIAERCANDPELLGEVESLLGQTTGVLEGCAVDVIARRDLPTLEAGRRLGAYAIVKELGRGGMGAVYLAERADGAFEKRVAIKVLKRGLDTDEILHRFLAEKQILARLDHPGIVRLIDAGTTDDGLPYFVMDYVEGESITNYASSRELSVPARLELFRMVCTAVTYAHQNLIVHRDLKPSNILVTKEGQVRLLDFGIAKLLEPETAPVLTVTMLRVMTPEYASPEQIRGELVTTISDVYSLGVILYELLTAERPYRLRGRSADEISKAICEQEPARPSTAVARGDGNSKLQIPRSKILKGDLDNVVLMALRKEPARRYASVEQFSEDIRRYLQGMPVRARQDTRGYRTAKFVRRNTIGVAAAMLLLLVLLAGIIATTWEWRAAKIERAKAEARFEILRKSSRTMISEIHGILMNLPGSLEARKLLLQRATEQLDTLALTAGDDWRLQIDLAQAYQNIGYLPDKSLAEKTELFEKAIALDESVLSKQPKNIQAREDLGTSKINLADFARARGDNELALTYNREAIVLLEAVAKDDPTEMEHKVTLWNASYNATQTLLQLGRAAEALEISQRIYPVAVELRDKYTADKSDHRFRRPYLSRATAAGCLTYLGRYDEAIIEIRAALEDTAAVRQRFPLGPYERLDECVFNYRLAVALERAGQQEKAIETAQKARSLAEGLLSDEPKNFSSQTNAALQNSQLGGFLLRAGKAVESIEYYQRSVQLYEMVLAADPERKQARIDLACANGGLGYALAQSGEVAQGLAAEREALASYDKLEAAKTTNVLLLRDYADTLARVGETYLLDKTYDSSGEAQQLLQRSFAIWIALRDRGALSRADLTKPEEIAAEIANR